MGPTVEVKLLGPIEVCADGRATPVAGVKLQSVVAMLAVAAPHVVSCDALVDGVWGEDPPANPTNALQALVSNLRRVLGRDAVVRQGPGYLLDVDGDLIDATRLARLVDEGRAAAADDDHRLAADRYREAVALVRGEPLGDLGEGWFARSERVRLDEIVLAAHEGLIDAQLSMGRHAEALVALTDLVRHHPLRERFRAQLIIALYRAGRQTEALRAARSARQYLADELGLEPGPELQALERSVLTHDPALAAPIALTPLVPSTAVVPTPLTSFVGRQDALARLDATVATARLSSIVGPAGVGKTRLVLELAGRLAESGEVWFVELAPVSRPDAVAEAVAIGVGAPERAPIDDRPAPSPEERAVERLGRRAVIVVLDNCEHVAVAAAACVVELLAGCPAVRVVTTGREPLGVEGEVQFALGPLTDEESAQLFVERAQAVEPTFGIRRAGDLDGDRDPELVELCRHLDRLPLAIELAAARAKTLPLPELSQRLRNRFQLLRRARSSGTARHDGLEAAIDWSYDLLFDDERRTFRRLAVFAGGVTVEAAEWLCGPDAFDLASRLVDRSLMVADTTARVVRFGMLESLRAYGLDRLAEQHELAQARADHLRWCIELAERGDRGARGRDQLDWLRRLDEEHDNVLVALGYAVEHDPDGALRLMAALAFPWWFRGRRLESRRWTEASLAAGADGSPLLLARVLALSGLVTEPTARTAGGPAEGDDLRRALAAAEARQRRAVTMCADSGDDHDVATSELLLLNTLARRVSSGEAVDADEVGVLVDDAAARFDGLGDDFGSAVVRVTHAMFAIATGDLPGAASSIEAALKHAERSGDRFSTSRIEYVLGMIDDLADDPQRAYRHIERSLRLADELGINQAVTAQARLLGPLAERCGEPELAATWRAFVADRSDGWSHYDATVMASARNHEGLGARAAGDPRRAADAHYDALSWYTAAGIPAGIARSHSCLGFLATERADRVGAASHHAAALAAARDSDDAAALALALEGAASVSVEPVVVARLLGAASALRSPSSAAPTHRADVAATAEAARRALGAEAYEAALADGAALDRRGALALARHGAHSRRA